MNEDKHVITFVDACDWLTGYLLRKPETSAAILLQSVRGTRSYMGQLGIPGLTEALDTPGTGLRYINGSTVRFYSMLRPHLLRGTLFAAAIVQDWDKPDPLKLLALENLQYAVRLGDQPRIRYVLG